jgi:SNF2 family DNA or RNA helicase
MGLGKSRQALLAAEGRTLVVAPGMIRDMGVWQTEQAKWAPDLDLTVVSYHELPYKRADLTTNKAGNKVFRFKMTDDLNKELRQHWDTVIFDEAHYLKSRKTHWSVASFQLKPERMMLLTGTPIPNWGFELFMLLRHLRPQDNTRGGPLGSYWRWVGEWFEVGQLKTKDGRVITEQHTTGVLKDCTEQCSKTLDTCEHWERFRKEEFGDLWIRRLRADVLGDLPPLTGADELYRVPMVPAQATAYKQLKKTMLATLESGEDILAWSKPGLLTKLRKLASGLECVSDTGKGSGKLDVISEILANRSRPTLIVAQFHTTMDAIGRRCDELGLRWRELSGRTPNSTYRRATGEMFQRGELDVLVGQVDTVSEGLTLTRSDMVIIAEHSWRPAKNQQVIQRIHRIGQSNPCTVIRLVTQNTVDENMQELLKVKTDEQVRALPASDWKNIL